MIFPYDRYCRPEYLFEGTPPQGRPLGPEGCLHVVAVTAGSCLFAWNGGEEAYAPTGNLVAAAGAPLLQEASGGKILLASLSGTAPRELAAGLERPLLLQPAAAARPAALLQQLAAMEANTPAASALGYSLLCALAEAEQPQQTSALVADAVTAIHSHFSEVYGVEELAAELGVSKSHLVRRFSAVMGITPGRYLTQVRLQAAKRLLLHRAYSLETVAGLCGFSGANYFCRVFKKDTGETPAAWCRHNSSVAAATELPPGLRQLEQQLYL